MPRPRVIFQGDYELLSAQFAGLVVAVRHGLFTKKGIDVVLRGRVRPGSEADVVVAIQETAKLMTPSSGSGSSSSPPTLALGCAEQNIVVPAQANGAKVKVVSAMYQKSPLGLGLRPDSPIQSLRELAKPGVKVGMLADSLTLAQAMLRQAATTTQGGAAPPAASELPQVVEATNADKIGRLLRGELDAIQIYDATEPVEMEMGPLQGQAPKFLPFGPSLGYAQAIFAHGPTLAKSPAHRELLHDFLETLYEGWELAFEDPKLAARLILDERHLAKVGPDSGSGPDSAAYHERVLRNLEAYVAPDGVGSARRLGTVSTKRFEEANAFFLKAGLLSKPVKTEHALDNSIWK